MGKIKDLPINSRPREKGYRLGVKNLTNAELLAVIIQSGTKTHSALDIANELLNSYGSISDVFSTTDYQLQQCIGISKVKSIQLLAIKELFIRVSNERISKQNLVFNSIVNVYNYAKLKVLDLYQEKILALYLNVKNVLIYEQVLSLGDDSSVIVDKKFICKTAIEKYAKKVILIHNHPSNNLTPSIDDVHSFCVLKEALKLFDIKLLDSIIISNIGFYSINNDTQYNME